MPVPETIAMSTDEGLARRKSFVQVPPLTEKVLVAAILLLFLLLHCLAGMILQSAGSGERATSASDRDALRLYG